MCTLRGFQIQVTSQECNVHFTWFLNSGDQKNQICYYKPSKNYSSRDIIPLKGQCHEIFCFWLFS